MNKFLSMAGISSRRAADKLIEAGKVSVNGRLVRSLGTQIDPRRDTVKVEGRTVRPSSRRSYYLLNKPRRVVCTLSDPQGRRTVGDLLPEGVGRLYPVGRLDWDAEGVLILTDDGELAHRLSHPRYRAERTYMVKLSGRIDNKGLARLERGLRLEDGWARAEGARLVRATERNSWISMTLREGRYHEVKRLCAAAGFPVLKIRRVSYAGLTVRGMMPGSCRSLTPAEVSKLRNKVGHR